ncbi:hypothetical protein K470DRAFT_264544 [Piedraia hortae CBS 480.64]|uniref:Uncharacterized protein n=1 Tax=Piedraia hortae CBS 480.64 TaxID=1314780 RepID=A0A6A7BZ87_9PEZI|nr:hypothetical protein K470DRAFT_264544 [Piedraia hortae CBS 480.64]
MDEKHVEVSKKLHAAGLEVRCVQAEMKCVEKSKNELRKRLSYAKKNYAWEIESNARAAREGKKVAELTVQLESTKILLAEERRERAKLQKEQKTQATEKPATQSKEKREPIGKSPDRTTYGFDDEMLAS